MYRPPAYFQELSDISPATSLKEGEREPEVDSEPESEHIESVPVKRGVSFDHEQAIESDSGEESPDEGDNSNEPDQLLPEFNKRPLSDTPVMSGSVSPSIHGIATSPLNLSDTEDSDGDDYESERRQRVHEAAVNTLKNITIQKDFQTTIDIPGQTSSKSNPKGIVVTPERVVVVMIGLPARGKSYLANKLTRYLNWLQINCRLFNVGSTRRKESSKMGPENYPLPDNNSGTTTPEKPETSGTSHRASFFSPDNKDSIKLREKWAMDTLDALLHYLLEEDGCVGIFDATNTTKARRQKVLNTIIEKSNGQLKVLFLESICTDKRIVDQNIRLKLSGPDYKHMDPEIALQDFVARLTNYERAYETIDEEEEKLPNFQYVKMVDVGKKVIAFNIHGFLASQIIYYLLNFNLSERQIWITRHGESTDNVKGRIGGDSSLTPRGDKFSKALARFIDFKRTEFRKRQLQEFHERLEIKYRKKESQATPDDLKDVDEEVPVEPSFCVWSSMSKRSIETTRYFDDREYLIKEMKMLDELGAGKMDGMTYEEIQKIYPNEFQARLVDKLTYRYPGVGGESYLDVINRLRPVITEIERTTSHLLLVTHRVVTRILLGYFLNLDKEAIGDLDVPLHTVYLLEPKPFGVDWSFYDYDEASDWFVKIDPETLENRKKVKQVGISFRERKFSVVPTAPRISRPGSFVFSDSNSNNSTAVSGTHSVQSVNSTTKLADYYRNRTNQAVVEDLRRARGQAPNGSTQFPTHGIPPPKAANAQPPEGLLEVEQLSARLNNLRTTRK
ncbi:BA75_01926T0 [Komagataella pastoris]|uniref:BA75_01926T0 n=1 Tax=Komagataella pastoris TaxID=4922 RepID=A0A1B2JC72_PICPA|nr:BA75_01926T0 [Komagataella pastoris]